MISIPKNTFNFNALKFAFMALPVKKSSNLYSLVLIENNVAYCTDGYRLHAAMVDIESGTYEINKNLNTTIHLAPSERKFPDVQCLFNQEKTPLGYLESRYFAQAPVELHQKTGRFYDPDYLKPLLNSRAHPIDGILFYDDLIIETWGMQQMLAIGNMEIAAFIMPLREDD